MKMGMVESFIIIFPRLMLLAIVVLIVMIIVKISKKNSSKQPTLNTTKPHSQSRSNAVPGEARQNQKYCSNCGAALKDGARFCTECGTKVDD